VQTIVVQEALQFILWELMGKMPLDGIKAEPGSRSEAVANIELGELMIEIGTESHHVIPRDIEYDGYPAVVN
jgi:hypothetical protein